MKVFRSCESIFKTRCMKYFMQRSFSSPRSYFPRIRNELTSSSSATCKRILAPYLAKKSKPRPCNSSRSNPKSFLDNSTCFCAFLLMGVYSFLFFGFFVSYILPKIRSYTPFCNFHPLLGRCRSSDIKTFKNERLSYWKSRLRRLTYSFSTVLIK